MHVYLYLLFLFSGVLLTLAALAWCHRDASVTCRWLCLFFAAEGFACLAYGMSLASASLDAKVFWNHAEYLVGVPVIPLTVLLALRLTGYDRRLPGWSWGLLLAVPVAGLVLNWTWPWHALYYERVWLEPTGKLVLLAKAHGPLYGVFMALMYVELAVALGIFCVRQARHRRLSKGDAWLVGLALLAPLVSGLPYYWFPIPGLHRLNTLYAGFFLTALMFGMALFRGRFQALMRALDEARARNELLLAHANAIFYTISPDGRFSYVSDSWQQFLGHAAEEVVGREYRDLVLPEDIPSCDLFLQDVVRSGELRTGIEYRMRHKDGSVRWHTSSIKPVRDWKGLSTTFVGVAHDITPVKQIQEALRDANLRLRMVVSSRNAELRAAVAGALDASEGESRRIGREIHDGLCQDLVGLLRAAEGVAQRTEGTATGAAAQELVEQVTRTLGLARGVSHELALHDLESLTLGEALGVFARRFGATSGIQIEVNCSPECQDMAPGVAEHVYRVVREAVFNALRHGRARNVWIDLVRERDQIVASVTNDGIGLVEGAEPVPGVGLSQIRMRAQLLGGTFRLWRQAQGKTVAELTVPMEAGEGGDA